MTGFINDPQLGLNRFTAMEDGTYTIRVSDANTTLSCEQIIELPFEDYNVSISNGNCGDDTKGSIDLMINKYANLEGPYAFNWMYKPTETGQEVPLFEGIDENNNECQSILSELSSGYYCVTITGDNNKTRNACYPIAGGQMTTNISSTFDCVCSGEENILTANVFGGSGELKYSWSNGSEEKSIMVSEIGNYSVTVTDDMNGCTSSESISLVTCGPEMVFDIEGYGFCSGKDDAWLLAYIEEGGIPPFTYSIKGVFSDYFDSNNTGEFIEIPVDEYLILATDASGCIKETTFNIPPVLTIEIEGEVIGAETGCENSKGSIIPTITGAREPSSYLWEKLEVDEYITVRGGASNEPVHRLGLFNVDYGVYRLSVTDIRGCSASKEFTIEGDGDLNPLSLITGVECISDDDPGSVELLVEGGEEPYSYRMIYSDGSAQQIVNSTKPIFEVTRPTNYAFRITDNNGCLITDQVFVRTCECPEIIVTSNLIIQNATTCNLEGGSVINRFGNEILGGRFPIKQFVELPDGSRIEFSDTNPSTVNGLSEGMHKLIIVDANDCEGETTFNVGLDEDRPEILENIEEACVGVDNGTIETLLRTPNSISYEWSNGANTSSIDNLEAGIYCVTITRIKDGCTNEYCYEVPSIEPESPLSLSGTTKNSCIDYPSGRIDLDVTGGLFLYAEWEYNWNPELNRGTEDLDAGIYCLTITDYCRTKVDDCFEIEYYPEFFVNYSIIQNCDRTSDIELEISGGTSGVDYTYQWSNGSEDKDLINISAGIYSVIVADEFGCVKAIEDIIVEELREITIETTTAPICNYTLSNGADVTGGLKIEIMGGVPLNGGGYNVQWKLNNDIIKESIVLNGEDVINGLEEPGIYNILIEDKCRTYPFEVQAEFYDIFPEQLKGSDFDCYAEIDCGGVRQGPIFAGLARPSFPAVRGEGDGEWIKINPNDCSYELYCMNGGVATQKFTDATISYDYEGWYDKRTGNYACYEVAYCVATVDNVPNPYPHSMRYTYTVSGQALVRQGARRVDDLVRFTTSSVPDGDLVCENGDALFAVICGQGERERILYQECEPSCLSDANQGEPIIHEDDCFLEYPCTRNNSDGSTSTYSVLSYPRNFCWKYSGDRESSTVPGERVAVFFKYNVCVLDRNNPVSLGPVRVDNQFVEIEVALFAQDAVNECCKNYKIECPVTFTEPIDAESRFKLNEESIQEYAIKKDMINSWVFPNPFEQSFELKIWSEEESQISIKIYDVVQHIIYEETLRVTPGENSNSIQLPDYISPGMYLLEVRDEENRQKVHKIVKANN